MIVGIERLRRARELLGQNGQLTADPDAGLLTIAAGEIWAAAIDSAAWPFELRVQATIVQGSMFRYGTIDTTVRQMTVRQRSQLRRDIIDFIKGAERFCE